MIEFVVLLLIAIVLIWVSVWNIVVPLSVSAG